MTRSLLSILIALMIGGGVGFLAGAYFVPTDQAMQFRGLVDGGVDALSKALHTGDVKTDAAPAPAPPETANAPAAPRIGADPACDPARGNCAPPERSGVATPADAPQADAVKPENPSAPARMERHGKAPAGRGDPARRPGGAAHPHPAPPIRQDK